MADAVWPVGGRTADALHCRFGLAAASVAMGGWVVAVGVVVGVLAAVSCLRCSLQALDRQGRPPKKTAKKHLLYPLTDIRKGSPPLQKHRDVLQQASRLAVAVALCIAAMLAVYALTGHFTNAVLLGALIGFCDGDGKLPLAEHHSLQRHESCRQRRAARRRRSWRFRRRASSARSFWSSFISCCFRAGLCDPLAAILPLLFAQVCIKLIDFFRPDPQAAQKTKDGDSNP